MKANSLGESLNMIPIVLYFTIVDEVLYSNIAHPLKWSVFREELRIIFSVDITQLVLLYYLVSEITIVECDELLNKATISRLNREKFTLILPKHSIVDFPLRWSLLILVPSGNSIVLVPLGSVTIIVPSARVVRTLPVASHFIDVS